MILITLLVLILTLFIILIKKLHGFYQYFKKANIKHLKPIFIFGNSFQEFLGKKHSSELVEEAYFAFPDEDVIGYYHYIVKICILRNPQLIEKVMIKDFSHFMDRMKPRGPINNAGDASLFLLVGNTWRAVRYKFTPLFTSNKLRYMYNSINDCGQSLMTVLEKNDGKEVDIGDVLGMFAMDVIGSCTFGMDIKALENPESDFRKMGKNLFKGSLMNILRILLLVLVPNIAKMFGITSFFKSSVVDYYCKIILETMEERKQSGVERNDFVQLLLKLKEKGKIEVQIHDKNDEYLDLEKSEETFELQVTDDILVGGAFTFLTAGFHSTAVTLTYTIYELARRPDIVEKIKAEIQEKIKEDNITYDDLKSMTYLDKVLKEVLRLHPSVTVIGRVCTKEYTLPNGYKIMPGQNVSIPVSALHKDPAYFPDPLTFNPDRFDVTPLPGTYLPFGDGPRVCIAMRFAQLEMKFALVKLMNSFEFTLSENTKYPLQLDPRAMLNVPKDGVKVYVKKIDKTLSH